MANTCININSLEFRILKDKSGLSDFDLSYQIAAFQDRYGRWPFLDELKGANSEPYIQKVLELRKDGSTKISKILEVTGTQDIKDAVIWLNNEFRDKEINIIPLKDDAIVEITTRPNETEDLSEDIYEQEEYINSGVLMMQVIDKLQKLYGINIHYISNEELNGEEWVNVPGVQTANGFIYNGDIYINTDNASIDVPLHEMLHLIFGSVRYQNPDLYYSLVEQAKNFKSLERIAKRYPYRTEGDLYEEVFITELAKHLVGLKSDLSSLDEITMRNISYDTYRVLDSILMGGLSTKTISEPVLYNLNLRQISQIVNSSILQSVPVGTMDDATIHRIMANIKSELLENNELEQICGSAKQNPVKDLVGGAKRNARDSNLFRENLRNRYGTNDPEVFEVNGVKYSDNPSKGKSIDKLHVRYIDWAKNNNLI